MFAICLYFKRYLINIFVFKKMTSLNAFGTETFYKQTRERGITKGATISQTKLDNYIRCLTIYIIYDSL